MENTYNNITVDPVYFLHRVIRDVKGNINQKLSEGIHETFEKKIYGCQYIKGVWFVYMPANGIRELLLNNGITLENRFITFYNEYPQNQHIPTERLVIKDLPAFIPHSCVTDFLEKFRQLTSTNNVSFSRDRVNQDTPSEYINGDRHLYVHSPVTPPLPKDSYIEGWQVRLWHKTQNNYCRRCAEHGHKTDETDRCPSYQADAPTIAFRADSHPFSNYYMCKINVFEREFPSAEHAYQWRKCQIFEREDLALRVLCAKTPREAKETVAELTDVQIWTNDVKILAMKCVLVAKFQSCELFRTRLLDCKDKIIAEATSDTFWGVGVAPNIAIFTNPDKFLGCNVLGNLLMNLRDSTKSAKFAQEHTANPPQELITGSKADDLGPPDNNHQSIASTNNISDSVPPQPDGGNPTQPAPPTVHDMETDNPPDNDQTSKDSDSAPPPCDNDMSQQDTAPAAESQEAAPPKTVVVPDSPSSKVGSPPESTDPPTESQVLETPAGSANEGDSPSASPLTDAPNSNPSAPACEVETSSSGMASQPTPDTLPSPPASKDSGGGKNSGKVMKFIENDIELFPRLLLASEPEPRIRRKARALARGTDYTRSSSESNLVRRDMKSIDSFFVRKRPAGDIDTSPTAEPATKAVKSGRVSDVAVSLTGVTAGEHELSSGDDGS